MSALDGVARAGGATIDAGAKVTTIDADGHHFAIGFGEGQRMVARSVVIAAGGPSAAARPSGSR